MVVPFALATGTRHDFTSTPSTNTEQVPHSPAPQPSLLPVRPRSSRRKSSRRRYGLALRAILRPLTVASIRSSSIGRLQPRHESADLAAGRAGRRDQAANDKAAHHLAAILLARARGYQRHRHLGGLLQARGRHRAAAQKLLDLGQAPRHRAYAADSEAYILKLAPGRIKLHQRCEAHKRDHQRAAVADLLEAAVVAG